MCVVSDSYCKLRKPLLQLHIVSEHEHEHEHDARSDLLALALVVPVPGLTSVAAAEETYRAFMSLFGPMAESRAATQPKAVEVQEAVEAAKECLPSIGERYHAAFARYHDALGGGSNNSVTSVDDVLARMRRFAFLAGVHARRINSRLPKGDRWPLTDWDMQRLAPAEQQRLAELATGAGHDALCWRLETRIIGAVSCLQSPGFMDTVPLELHVVIRA